MVIINEFLIFQVENEVYNPLASGEDSRNDPNAKYNLSEEEWKDIFAKEQILKKKKNPMDSQQMRVELLKEKFLVKEALVRESVSKVYDTISFELEV
jgi:hypothetical protein